MSIMNIEMRSLRHVVVLARELNYTRAATILHITQSTLSRSIQSIEERLDLKLFDRDRGGVSLTPAGSVFAQRATAILKETDDLEFLMKRLAGGSEGDVSFGMPPLLAKILLPQILSEEIKSKSDLRSDVLIRQASNLYSLLLEERIDFFLCLEEQIPLNTPVKMHSLGQIPLSLIGRSNHPLIGRPPKSKDVDSYPMVSYAPIFDSNNALHALPDFVSKIPSLIVEDHWLLLHVVEHSDALCFTSPLSVINEMRSGRISEIRSLLEEGSMLARVMIYSLERRSLSPAAKRFRDLFLAEIQRLKAEYDELV